MVGCSLITRAGGQWCGDRLDAFDFPFTLGPFATPASFNVAPVQQEDALLDWRYARSKGPSVLFDLHVYSLTLLACDVLLTLAWHYVTQVLFSKNKPLRLKFLSPSARMTLGMLFGVGRLWALSYLNIVPFVHFLAKVTFAIGFALGWAALVFDDGPWSSLRPNSRAALARDSLLNPLTTFRMALAAAPTKIKLAQRIVRRKLEAGGVVSIVLDVNGSLLYAASGPFDVRRAVELCDGQRAVELVGRMAPCLSGDRMFFGFKQHAPFDRRASKPMTREQRKALLDLMNGLNMLAEPMNELRVFNVSQESLNDIS